MVRGVTGGRALSCRACHFSSENTGCCSKMECAGTCHFGALGRGLPHGRTLPSRNHSRKSHGLNTHETRIKPERRMSIRRREDNVVGSEVRFGEVRSSCWGPIALIGVWEARGSDPGGSGLRNGEKRKRSWCRRAQRNIDSLTDVDFFKVLVGQHLRSESKAIKMG
jgi:hypothetical protein